MGYFNIILFYSKIIFQEKKYSSHLNTIHLEVKQKYKHFIPKLSVIARLFYDTSLC